MLLCWYYFQLTVADLAVYNAFDTPTQNNPNLMDSYTKLKAHRTMVANVPAINSYTKARTQTDV